MPKASSCDLPVPLVTTLLATCSPLSCTAHTCAPYIIASCTTTVYIRHDCFIDGPHIDAVILERASYALRPFWAAKFVISFQLILGSTQTPSTHNFVSGFTWWLLICRVLARSPLGSCLCFEKCISWYLSGANCVPCLADDAMHFSCALSSFWQFSLAELPQVTRFVSSIKPNASVSPLACWNSSSSSVIKKINRIGDSGDP